MTDPALSKKIEPIALFDMDGTLCDYEGQMRRDLAKLEAPGGDCQDWVEFGESAPHIEARMDLIKNQSGWWRCLPMRPMGFQILEIVKSHGFDIHVLTKGPFRTTSAWSEKVEWCRVNLPGVPVTITEDKGLMYGKILVDDYPPYIDRWLKWRPRGLVIMPAHKYNRGFEHPNVIRYDGSKSRKGEVWERCAMIKGECNHE